MAARKPLESPISVCKDPPSALCKCDYVVPNPKFRLNSGNQAVVESKPESGQLSQNHHGVMLLLKEAQGHCDENSLL